MKKTFLALAIFTVLSTLFAFKVNAFSTTADTSSYLNDTTVTLSLTAKPVGDENAVSINLIADGMTILNYTPPTGTWVGVTPDCDNDQTYSATMVCTSMAKPTPIEDGESLGTVTVKVKGSTYATLTKTSDNAYSDGKSIRTDSGVLVEFNADKKPANSSNPGVVASSQPLIIIAALVVVVVLILLMLWPKIKSKLQKPPASTTPF